MVGSSFSALPGGLQRIESPEVGWGGFSGTGRLQTDHPYYRRRPSSDIGSHPGALEFKRYGGGGQSTGLPLDGAWHQHHYRLSKLPQ